jgi:hypothetical protein
MKNKDSDKSPVNQGRSPDIVNPKRIAGSTHYDFNQGKNLTPYGGLFPVATMLERLGLQKLVEETLPIKRIPRAMNLSNLCWGCCCPSTWDLLASITSTSSPRDPRLTGILELKSAQSAPFKSIASQPYFLTSRLV